MFLMIRLVRHWINRSLSVIDDLTFSEVPVAVASGVVKTTSLFLLYSMLSSPSEQAVKTNTVSRDSKKNVVFFIWVSF